jgi:hypothetical protein
MFTCPICGRISHNPNDIAQGYCGACHDWTAEPFWMQDVRIAQRRIEASRLAARSTDDGQAASDNLS